MDRIVKAVAVAGSLLDLGKVITKAAKDGEFTGEEIDKIVDGFGHLMSDVLDAVDFPMTIRVDLGYRIKAIGEQLINGKRF